MIDIPWMSRVFKFCHSKIRNLKHVLPIY